MLQQQFIDTIPQQEVSLAINTTISLLYSQLFIQLERTSKEWIIEWNHFDILNGNPCGQWRTANIERYVLPENQHHAKFSEVLADRSIVTKLNAPLNLLPNSNVMLFVGTPIWLRLSFGEKKIKDFPVIILSDTWFGTSTREGEVCYSSNTRARLDKSLFSVDSYKALTPIEVKNKSDENLVLDKINVPLPILSLYRNSANELLTSSIKIEVDNKLNDAALTITEPNGNDHIKKIGPPRNESKSKVIKRTLDLLFS